MKRLFTGMTMLVATFFHASTALAGGLNLAWDNCASDGGLQARVSDCLTNTGSNTLVGSFVPIADIAGITGVEYVLDVLIGDGVSPIPPWWELVGIAACRDFGVGPLATLTANAVAPVSALACPDWASGNASGGLAAYYELAGTISPVNQPAHRRVVVGFAVPLANAVDLVSTHEYFGFNLVIRNYKTVGAGSCSGCLEPACIVLNYINIVPGILLGQHIQAGTSAGSNFATWQTSAPDCHLVPTKNTTWSAVKRLYH